MMRSFHSLLLVLLLAGGLTLVGCEDEVEETEIDDDTEAMRDADLDEDLDNRAARTVRTGGMGDEDYTARQAGQNQDDRQPRMAENRQGGPSWSAGPIQIEMIGDREVRVGQPFQYTLAVRNTADIPMHDVVVSQWSPQSLEIEADQSQQGSAGGWSRILARSEETASSRPQDQAQRQDGKQGGQRAQGGQGQQGQASRQAQADQNLPQHQWQLGMLEPGQSKNIRVRGTAREQGPIRTCFAVDYEPGVCVTLQAVKPDIQITRRIVDDEGQPIDQAYLCDEVFVTYSITNTGSGETGELQLVEDFGDGVEPRKVERRLQGVSAGQTQEVQRVRLQASKPMTVKSKAMVKATGSDLSATTEAGDVLLMKPELSLSVDGPKTEYIGRDVTYRVRVTNTSEYPALRTAVMFDPPEAMTNMSLDTQQIEQEGNTFRIGRLGPGESREFSLTFTAGQVGQVQAKFAAKAYCVDAITRTLATQFRGIPAVQLSCVDGTDPVKVGQETIYDIRVVNEGSAPDMNIRVSAKLPEGLEFVGADGDSKVSAGSGQELQFAPIKSLEPGEAANWKVRVRAKSADKVLFRLRMHTDTRKQAAITSEPTTLY